MALSRLAVQFAAEINNHDWSTAPWRRDRAGHDRIRDGYTGQTLSDDEVESVKTNAAWVTAQVLAFNDPNFDVYEFFEACGLHYRNRDGSRSGLVGAGLRSQYGPDGTWHYAIPGTWDYEDAPKG